MNYLSVDNLSKSYGEKVLFQDLSFGLKKGDKVALIANNGTGKSSLLKILSGKDVADSGTTNLRKGIKVGYLAQEPLLPEKLSIEKMLQGAVSGTLEIIRKYEKALANQTENYNTTTHKAFEEASSLMDQHNAWDHEHRMKQILSLFNITDLEQKIHSLSGGQKKRLALALVLIENPDLLILDEPTNHLDIDMIEWLEKYLIRSNITLLMVTHDRYFLDRICNNILELSDGKLFRHNGNYEYFLEKKAEREELEKTELHKARQLMKKELQWMRRMPQARATKSKARIDAFYKTKEKAGRKISDKQLQLDVKMSRVGGKILELDKVSKSYGNIRIAEEFEYIFKKGEKIGIIGKNGVGKTSFLNLLTGFEDVDSGMVIKGETIKFGYYKQEGIAVKEDKRVIDVVKEIAEVIEMADGSRLTASQFLQHFMFTPEMQFAYVSNLSGGEKRRLYLLTILIKNPNFLILDEPTNDLDLLVLNKLEEFLMGFKGCLILVSHDRYFLDKLSDHLFIFEGEGKIRDYYGLYSEYRQEEDELERKQSKEKTEEKRAALSREKEEKKKVKTKLSFKEKLEYENLEKEIGELENEKSELESRIDSGEMNYEQLGQVSSRIAELMNLIDEKTLRWMELDELV